MVTLYWVFVREVNSIFYGFALDIDLFLDNILHSFLSILFLYLRIFTLIVRLYFLCLIIRMSSSLFIMTILTLKFNHFLAEILINLVLILFIIVLYFHLVSVVHDTLSLIFILIISIRIGQLIVLMVKKSI